LIGAHDDRCPAPGDALHRPALAVVFLVSRRCNLECTYCNVDAGPRQRTSLAPQRFESWIRAFGEVGDLDLGIQLHGGEPLILEPPVEVLASIARNALIPYPNLALGTIGIVTNGIALDDDRATSLMDAGLSVAVSIDGPQALHDRHRIARSGRGSHQQAMRGLAALRRAGPDPPIIAVISEPSDLTLALEFFMSEGLSRVKINPMRPEGRGAAMRGQVLEAHMVALADAYFEAAQALASNNRSRPHQPIFEENIAAMTARVLGGDRSPASLARWTLLIDDRGRLWSHPGGYGVPQMALSDGDMPSPAALARTLGVDGQNRAEGMMRRQRATFAPCAGCSDPHWCSRFRPVVGGPVMSPDCIWRNRLVDRLEEWSRRHPRDAAAVVPMDRAVAATDAAHAVDAPPGRGDEDVSAWLDEPVDPVVGALLADIRISNGRAHVANYAHHAEAICRLSAATQPSTFLQLARLACGFARRRDRLALAHSLARLARVGLEPLARHASGASAPR
jgi:hypothetical protein